MHTMHRSLERRLLSEIRRIPILDTHEHLEEEGNPWRLDRSGWAMLLHYVACDFVAAGVPAEILERAQGPGLAPEERWDLIAPWWPAVTHGSYAHVLLHGVKALHGIETVSRETVPRLEAAMRASYPRGAYRRALKTLANIELSLVDPLEPDPRDGGPVAHRGSGCDPEYFLCDYHERVTDDPMVAARRLQARTGHEVKDLSSLKKALADDVARAASYAPAIKITLGYTRELDFEAVAEEDAAPLAAKAIAGERLEVSEHRALVDHLVDYLADLGADLQLPVKLHTGLHAGGRNFPSRTQVEPLTGLIRRHPRTGFDLFHLGWPNFRDAALLTKYYANVHLDFCWTWEAVPADARIALDLCLDLCPVTKLFGFGGDYFHLEGAIGASALAREGIASVLARRVAAGRHTEDEALEIARTILHDAPARFFRTEEKRAASCRQRNAAAAA
jgi:hypothetical protein